MQFLEDLTVLVGKTILPNKVWVSFSRVPIVNGPGKLLPFTLKIEVSIVLHQHDKTIS